MSALSARILGAVAAVAFVISPVATARIATAGSAPPSPGPATATGVAEPISALVPAYAHGVDGGVGTWEQFAQGGRLGSRSYFVYTPPGLDPGKAVPLVVVLHGCSQSADLALGSGVNGLADRLGFVVVYPEQSVRDNPRRCWNWFDVGDQVRGFGEPADIAAITEKVLSRPGAARLDRSRVYVMGMSAGAAMAGILAATYPDLYAAVGMHSGLEYAAAQNVVAAFLAMKYGGPEPHVQGLLAYAAMGLRARVVPAIVFQGGADETVRPVNGDIVVRQWLATSRLASGDFTRLSFARPQARFDARAPGGLAYTVRTWNDFSGRPVVQYWTVPGLAHAWSGGAIAGSFTDPRGPSATEAMYDFFVQSR